LDRLHEYCNVNGHLTLRRKVINGTGMAKKKSTKSSNFGSPGRSGHDASAFYSGKMYDGLHPKPFKKFTETPLPENIANTIFCKSSEAMHELPDSSVHLIVTSPPYNVGKTYDRDLTLEEYRSFLMQVMKEAYRVLVSGGRICINLANLGRKPYLPMEAFITTDLISLGFLMRGQIIWDKGSSSGTSTAWGSWISATNPTVRDIHEYVLIFSKDTFARPKVPGRTSTITRTDFLELTKSIWTFPSESARRIGHPAPFPVELARRCIELFTFSDEVILDPFMGSGSTAVAAQGCNRRFIGYEIDEEFIKIAQDRLSKRIEVQLT
jgi:site-specific DNA-methyltransferase (adenine-specific)